MIESLRNEYGYYRLYDKYNVKYYQNKYRCFATPKVDNEYLCFLRPEEGAFIEDAEFGAIKEESYSLNVEKNREVARLKNLSLYTKIQSITSLIRSKLCLNAGIEEAFILGTLNDRRIEEIIENQLGFRDYGELKQFYESIMFNGKERQITSFKEQQVGRETVNSLDQEHCNLGASNKSIDISLGENECPLKREGSNKVREEEAELTTPFKKELAELESDTEMTRCPETRARKEKKENVLNERMSTLKQEENSLLERNEENVGQQEEEILANRKIEKTAHSTSPFLVDRNNALDLKEQKEERSSRIQSKEVAKTKEKLIIKDMILSSHISKDDEVHRCHKVPNKVGHIVQEKRFDRPIANKELIEDDKKSSIIIYEKKGKPILKDDSEYTKMGKAAHRLSDEQEDLEVGLREAEPPYKKIGVNQDKEVHKSPERLGAEEYDKDLMKDTTRKIIDNGKDGFLQGLKKGCKDVFKRSQEQHVEKMPKRVLSDSAESYVDHKMPEQVNSKDQGDETVFKDDTSRKVDGLGDELTQTGLVDTKDRKVHIDNSEEFLEKEASKLIYSEDTLEESRHLNRAPSKAPHMEEEFFTDDKREREVCNEGSDATKFLDKNNKDFAVDKNTQEVGVKNNTSHKLDREIETCLRKQIKKVLEIKEREVAPTFKGVYIEEETRLNMFSRLWFLKEIKPYDLLEISCLNVYPLQAEWLPRADEKDYKYIYRKRCRSKFIPGSSLKIRILLDDLTLIYDKHFQIPTTTELKDEDDLIYIKITEEEVFLGIKKEVGYIVLHHSPDDKGGVIDVVAQPDLYLTQEHPFKDLGAEIGHLEMNVSIPIMVDFINICLFIWARFFIPFSGMTSTQALKRYVGTINNWLALESSHAKVNIAHYERCLAWLVWNAEMIYHKHKVDLNLSGNLAIEELIAELIYYMEIHHLDVVPLWESIAKMDEQRNIFEDADFEMPVILDKIKGLRHKLNSYT